MSSESLSSTASTKMSGLTNISAHNRKVVVGLKYFGVFIIIYLIFSMIKSYRKSTLKQEKTRIFNSNVTIIKEMIKELELETKKLSDHLDAFLINLDQLKTKSGNKPLDPSLLVIEGTKYFEISNSALKLKKKIKKLKKTVKETDILRKKINISDNEYSNLVSAANKAIIETKSLSMRINTFEGILK